MVSRMPQHAQRVEKKISDLLLDLDRSEEELKTKGYKPASDELKALEKIRATFNTEEIKEGINLLRKFPLG